jgi:hypothetical protein
MRTHYTPDPKRHPVLDVILAVAIGFCLAMLLVSWWSS